MANASPSANAASIGLGCVSSAVLVRWKQANHRRTTKEASIAVLPDLPAMCPFYEFHTVRGNEHCWMQPIGGIEHPQTNGTGNPQYAVNDIGLCQAHVQELIESGATE